MTCLERAVGRVVAAHEADLDQPAAVRDLGVDDVAAGLAWWWPAASRRTPACRRRSTPARRPRGWAPTSTRSPRRRRSSAIRSSPVACTVAFFRPAATCWATSALASLTATTSAPDDHVGESADVVLTDHAGADDSDSQCHVRLLLCVVRRCWASVGPAADGAEAAADVVAGGPGADRQRDVRLDGVEVLLDDREDLAGRARPGRPGAGACPARRTAARTSRRACTASASEMFSASTRSRTTGSTDLRCT